MSEYNIYATDETRRKLGFIEDYMADVSKTETTIVVSKSDLISQNIELTDDNYFENLNLAAQVLQTNLQEMQQAGIIPAFSGTNEEFFEYCQYLADNVIQENASAIKLDFDNDGNNDFGFVSTQNMEKPLNMTGFHQDYFIPGYTALESNTLTMLHEFAHLNQNTEHYQDMALLYEIDADTQAYAVYNQMIKDGMPLRPEGLIEEKQQRLVSSFVNPGNDMDFYFSQTLMTKFLNADIDTPTHTTHLFTHEHTHDDNLGIETHGMIMAKSFNNLILGMDEAQQASMNIVQQGQWDETQSYYMGSDVMYQELMYPNGIECSTMDPQDAEILSAGKAMGNLHSPLSLMDIGTRITQHDPVRALASAEAIVESGLFDRAQQNSPEVAYINSISDYFKTHGDILHNSPEFIEYKEYYKKFIEENKFVQKINFNGDLRTEIDALNADSIDLSQQIETLHADLLLAAEDAGNQQAIDALKSVNASTIQLLPSIDHDVINADDNADSAQITLSKLEDIIMENPDIIPHYPNIEENSIIPRGYKLASDLLSAKKEIYELEEKAVELNDTRPEYGLPKYDKVEFGLN